MESLDDYIEQIKLRIGESGYKLKFVRVEQDVIKVAVYIPDENLACLRIANILYSMCFYVQLVNLNEEPDVVIFNCTLMNK